MQSKKQLFNLFEEIAKLNNDVWDNKRGTYNDEHEAAMAIEEALEGLDDLQYLADELHYRGEATPKELSRQIVDSATVDNGTSEIADVDRFDKSLDALYIVVGGMHKLGLTPHQMVEGLQVVHNANLQKAGKKDEHGKVVKPADFEPPEAKLQLILDQRPTN